MLISRCVALWHPSTLGERLEHGVELDALVPGLGDPHLGYFTNWYQYAALVEAARIAEADIVLARCAEYAATLGQAHAGLDPDLHARRTGVPPRRPRVGRSAWPSRRSRSGPAAANPTPRSTTASSS